MKNECQKDCCPKDCCPDKGKDLAQAVAFMTQAICLCEKHCVCPQEMFELLNGECED